ncbi:MAG: V-type ATPase subunit [Chromatiales bacterium]|nr:V-type ATPase subunit [Gammaproteobacteria bacterium]MCP5351649.1 V-type ATPase subunit [Chromatiales bacterium]
MATPGISAKEAYLATRVRLMADRLVPPDALRAIINADGDTLRGRLRALGIEADDPRELVHSGRLFQVLLRHFLADFVILLRPLCPGGRQLFRYWLRRYELRNIKTIIRGRMGHQSTANIRANLLDLHPFEQVDTEALLGAEDVSELLRLLERSAFAGLARQARRVADQDNPGYRLDASLDREYLSRLHGQIAQARPEDQPSLRELIGSLIDVTDLVSLLRFRFAYQLPPAETYYLLIGHGERLHRQHLLKLVELPSLPEVLAALPESLRAAIGDATTTLAVERQLERRIAHRLMRTYRDSPSFVTRTLAFLMLRESDMHRLRSVMRGKFLGLPPALIHDSINLGPG